MRTEDRAVTCCVDSETCFAVASEGECDNQLDVWAAIQALTGADEAAASLEPEQEIAPVDHGSHATCAHGGRLPDSPNVIGVKVEECAALAPEAAPVVAGTQEAKRPFFECRVATCAGRIEYVAWPQYSAGPLADDAKFQDPAPGASFRIYVEEMQQQLRVRGAERTEGDTCDK